MPLIAVFGIGALLGAGATIAVSDKVQNAALLGLGAGAFYYFVIRKA